MNYFSQLLNHIKTIVIACAITTVFVSCNNKEKKITTPEIDIKSYESIKEDNSQLTHEWLKLHNNKNRMFNNIQIRAKVDYADATMDQSVDAKIQIEKEKQILITIQAYFFTIGKVYISPQRVSYYEIINGKHYDGDFTWLSQLLGTKLNYSDVEKVLLGELLITPSQVSGFVEEEESLAISQKMNKGFLLAKITNLGFLQEELITNENKKEAVTLSYTKYQEKEGVILPSNLHISSSARNNPLNIKVNYKKVEVNTDIKFNYKIPKGSESIL